MRKLRKSKNKLVCGILAGIAEYYDIDPTLVRIVFVLAMIFTGLLPAMIFYGAACLIMPG